MEKVLRANDDDVVVYVAPTKALVNQIAAEVQARFSKKYLAGRSLYAIHTRDYRVNNPTKCQVLVTVPHIFQIMLLSPHNAKSWVPRIKTIIFDEVHSIGQADDGVVWEQLLLMAPCQIIALSATIGNPTAFTDWLQTTQNAINIDLQMVEHNIRFSDLRKFMYSPSQNPSTLQHLCPKPALAPLGLEGVSGFDYLHPVVSLTNERRGIPDDLALESKDCLLLYQAMKKHENNQYRVSVNLSPPNAVPECNIAKAHILKWGSDLKTLLKAWMKDPKSPFQEVVEELGGEVHKAHKEDRQIQENRIEDMRWNRGGMAEFNEIAATALPMLSKLHEADALPAILFSYDRSGCERIADEVLNQLVTAEKRWRETSKAWKCKVAEYHAWEKFKQSKQERKRLESAQKSKRKARNDDDKAWKDDEKMSKQDRAREASDFADHQFEGFDPGAPSAEFSFANEKVVNRNDIEGAVQGLRWRDVSEPLIEAFQRGIGVHHAGMNRKVSLKC
jgi:superfamily II RNA helicase